MLLREENIDMVDSMMELDLVTGVTVSESSSNSVGDSKKRSKVFSISFFRSSLTKMVSAVSLKPFDAMFFSRASVNTELD